MSFLLPLISAIVPGAAPFVAIAQSLIHGGAPGAAVAAPQSQTSPEENVAIESGGGFGGDDFGGPLEVGPEIREAGLPTDVEGALVEEPMSEAQTVGGGGEAAVGGFITAARALAVPAVRALAPILAGAALERIATGVGGGFISPRGVHRLPAVESVVPLSIRRVAGTMAVRSIYGEYIRLRRSGLSHRQARRMALLAHGIALRRRRMRPTNVHALRRAVRRVRGFKRIARKVGALSVSGRGGRLFAARRHRFRGRRGDIDIFEAEDLADLRDEAEDFDLPESSVLEERFEGE